MKLVNSETGKEIKVGDRVKTFRGEEVTLERFTERRVYVKYDSGATGEYFPSVIEAKVTE